MTPDCGAVRAAVATIVAGLSSLVLASPAVARTILPVEAGGHCSAVFLWPLGFVAVASVIGILLTLDLHVLRQLLSFGERDLERRRGQRLEER